MGRLSISARNCAVTTLAVLLLLCASPAQGNFCQRIRSTWWTKRQHFRQTYRSRYTKEALEYCSKWDNDVDGCMHAPFNIANGAFVQCTIEGHGNHACVPSPCAFLNNGFCTPEMTGGFCQWFERVPDPKNPGKSKRARGCYRNPCHLSGSEDNSRYFCEYDMEFKQNLRLYSPKVTCGWCAHKIGCQNVDTNPLSGCDSIRVKWLNNLARDNARNGKKVGSLMVMKVRSSPDSPYRMNTHCWDRTKAFPFPNAKHQIECLYGIHPMCHPDLGYEWKYPIRDPVEGRALRQEGANSGEAETEEFDIGWTLSRHGHSVKHPWRRIQSVNVDDEQVD